jgi:hypothetical protein
MNLTLSKLLSSLALSIILSSCGSEIKEGDYFSEYENYSTTDGAPCPGSFIKEYQSANDSFSDLAASATELNKKEKIALVSEADILAFKTKVQGVEKKLKDFLSKYPDAYCRAESRNTGKTVYIGSEKIRGQLSSIEASLKAIALWLKDLQ